MTKILTAIAGSAPSSKFIKRRKKAVSDSAQMLNFEETARMLEKIRKKSKRV